LTRWPRIRSAVTSTTTTICPWRRPLSRRLSHNPGTTSGSSRARPPPLRSPPPRLTASSRSPPSSRSSRPPPSTTRTWRTGPGPSGSTRTSSARTPSAPSWRPSSRTSRPPAPAAAPPPAPPTPEPGPDWGEDDQGNPITTEEQAKKIYPRALFNAIKNSHQVEKLAKQNEELQRTLTQERQERIAARVEGKLNRLLAARPELFGQDPSAVQPGTVEWHRRAAVINHLNGLAASKQQTTLEADVAGALAIFGPATAPPPAAKGKGQQSPAGPSPTDLAAHYRAAELARTTGRAGATSVTRRDLLIEAKRQELEANGSPVVASGGGDDDDDLSPSAQGMSQCLSRC
jgi:hypothetical protein